MRRRSRSIGFRRIVFLNGHYDNTYAIAYACANAADRLPAGARAFPVNYWDGMTADEAGRVLRPDDGLHANKGETSAVLAINPDARRHGRARTREMPPFPEVDEPARGPHRVLLLVAGLASTARRTPARGATPASRPPSSASATSRSSRTARSACSTTSSAPSRRCQGASRLSGPAPACPALARPCPAPAPRRAAPPPGHPQPRFAFGSIAIELFGVGLSTACEVAERSRIRPPAANVSEPRVLAAFPRTARAGSRGRVRRTSNNVDVCVSARRRAGRSDQRRQGPRRRWGAGGAVRGGAGGAGSRRRGLS